MLALRGAKTGLERGWRPPARMADQLVLRAFTPEARNVLAAKLKDKKLPTKIHERYRLVGLVAEAMSANAAGKAVGLHGREGAAVGPSLQREGLRDLQEATESPRASHHS